MKLHRRTGRLRLAQVLLGAWLVLGLAGLLLPQAPPLLTSIGQDLLALMAVLVLALVVGVPLGALAGSGPRWVDATLIFTTDWIAAVPVVLLLAFVRPAGVSHLGSLVLLGLLRALEVGWVVRSALLRAALLDTTWAARSLGYMPLAVFLGQRLPAAAGPALAHLAVTPVWTFLLEFSAEWCGPCKQMAPDLQALARELEGKAKVVTLDIDKSPNIPRQMGVQSVPTFVVFHNGRPVGGKVGALRKAELRTMLEPFLPRAEGAIRPDELVQLIKAGRVTLVDTREAAVFGRARLPGAVNLPFDELEARLAELHMLPATPVLYCRSGDRTKDLAAKLAEQGVPVAFLEGGVLGWEAAGHQLERPD